MPESNIFPSKSYAKLDQSANKSYFDDDDRRDLIRHAVSEKLKVGVSRSGIKIQD